MSYEIVYDKRFVRLSDGRIIPMLLAGSSNCYQFKNGREIRERSWWPCFIGASCNKVADTPENIMAGIQAALPSTYGEWFKQGGKWIDDDALVRMYQSGIRHALSLEEYAEQYRYDDTYSSAGISITVVFRETDSWFATTGYRSWTANTTAKLESAITDAHDYCDTCPDGYSADMQIGFDIDDKLVLRHPTPKKRQRPISDTQDDWFVLQSSNNGYFVRLTKYGYKYSVYTDGAKKFASEKAAQTWLDKNRDRISFDGIQWHILHCYKYPHLAAGRLAELRDLLNDNEMADADYLCRKAQGARSYQTANDQSEITFSTCECEAADQWLRAEISSEWFANVVEAFACQEDNIKIG